MTVTTKLFSVFKRYVLFISTRVSIIKCSIRHSNPISKVIAHPYIDGTNRKIRPQRSKPSCDDKVNHQSLWLGQCPLLLRCPAKSLHTTLHSQHSPDHNWKLCSKLRYNRYLCWHLRLGASDTTSSRR